ncbi:hypothetical protein NIES4071_88810 [Calothrix sp. NIES-4071]|nr:hypothetical protein NIES4071_88810 [Calothrix sp. NIES-4071]BAZ63148.1 hypothetical protein NIES4105_88740 [Calothrix sp. NIES-4105]
MCKIEDKQKQVLLDIKRVADSLRLSIMLVGAGARILDLTISLKFQVEAHMMREGSSDNLTCSSLTKYLCKSNYRHST